jgi:hypothetical protein
VQADAGPRRAGSEKAVKTRMKPAPVVNELETAEGGHAWCPLCGRTQAPSAVVALSGELLGNSTAYPGKNYRSRRTGIMHSIHGFWWRELET